MRMTRRTGSVAFVVDVVEFRAPLDEHLQAAQSAVERCGVGRRPAVYITMADVLREEGSSMLAVERETYRSSSQERVYDEGIAVCTRHVKARLIATVVSVEIDVVVDQRLYAGIVTANGGDVCRCPALGGLRFCVRVLPEKPMHALDMQREPVGERRKGAVCKPRGFLREPPSAMP